MEAIKHMHGTLGIFAIILICLVLAQSFLFLRLAMRFNRKHKLVSDEEVKEAVSTGAVAAIGPSVNSIVIALSLIAMVGSATTFMLCVVIGAPGWELLMANIASSTAGVTLGGEGFTEAIFTFAIFCMVLGSAPYFLNTMIMLKPLDNMVEKSKAKKAKVSFMPYLSNSAMFGLLGYSVMSNLNSISSVAAVLASGVAYALFDKLAKKLDNSMLGSFSMAVAMIFGMLFGQIVKMMTPAA